jgi:tRNA(Ile)-lysidine synthase
MPVAGGLPQHFAAQMGQLLGPDFPTHIGVAVSGGGDSMALLHLTAAWARVYGIQVQVVTVDHGLRPESAAEARMVAGEAKLLGLPHTTLRWDGWAGAGNLQDTARQARIDLIAGWRGACRHILMGHTQDDQAETLLMRLARGSGVEGLAAMAPKRRIWLAEPVPPQATSSRPDWWEIVRPLLSTTRADLRHYADTLKIPYVDDPSNDDEGYARVRMRRLIGAEGLDTATLAQTAQRMARARTALVRRMHEVADSIVTVDENAPGSLIIDRDGFAKVEADTQLRLLAAALRYVSSSPYRPRMAALEAALETILSGGPATLHGALLLPKGGKLFVTREAKAVADHVTVVGDGQLWDNRWCIQCDALQGLQVRALTEKGLSQIGKLPQTGVPRAALHALPSIWDGDRLMAAHFGVHNDNWSARIVADFRSWLVRH